MSESLYARERAAVQGLGWQLTPELRARWESCRYSRRFMAYAGKCVVLYTLDANNVPQNKQVLRCSEINANNLRGFYSQWKSGPSDFVEVSQVPVELAPGVFLWHTNYSDAQYIPVKSVYNLRTSLILSAPAHPDTKKTGVWHIKELVSFQAEYPE